MMFTARIRADQLPERLDAEHFTPEFVSADKLIVDASRRLGCLKSLDQLRDPSVGLCYGVLQPRFVERGVPAIEIGDLATGVLQPPELRISKEQHHEYRRSAVVGGDILISVKGTLGVTAIAPDGIEESNVNRDIARLRVRRSEVDAHYLVVFLRGSHGGLSLQRVVRGTIQRNLNIGDLLEHPVLVPAALAQRYLGDKIRQAERLRERSRVLTDLSTLLLESLIDGLKSESDIIADCKRFRHDAIPVSVAVRVNRSATVPRHRTFRTSGLDSGRIDPWHHQPSFVEARKKLSESGPCMLLGEMIDKARGIRGGATPLGARYPDSGDIRFYRPADVHDLMIHRESAGFLSPEQNSDLHRSRLAAGDVLLTITGVHFGQSGVVSARHLPGNISQHSVRFSMRGHDASYLVAFLSCHYGQQMIWREAYGATRPAIDYPGVADILVRTPDPKVRTCIGDLVRILESSAVAALVCGAKRIVEHLIDGVLTEADLVAAQKALEAGDRSADREILKSLRQSDASDAKPLIADVDALYSLLDGSEGQDT
jgi:hypothetical protein